MAGNLLRFVPLGDKAMKASIILAIKREQRNRRSDGFRDGLHGKQEPKSVSDAVITHVTQVTVEDAPVTKLEEPASELPKRRSRKGRTRKGAPETGEPAHVS